MRDGFELRAIGEAELDAVMQVQAQCYPPAMQEPRDIVLSRIRAAGDTSLVASGPGGICAYVFAYRSLLGAVTELDSAFAPAARPDTLYVHDLAVAPAALGKGLGRALVERLLAGARRDRLAYSALVSVQDSERFWGGLGYVRTPLADAGERIALSSYPAGAAYMTRRL